MRTIDKKISQLMKRADKLAIKEVERLARVFLAANKDKVSEFVMAMGSFFVCDKKGDIIHTFEGNNLPKLDRMKGYKRLVKFIEKWDEQLKITGEPMRIKHNCKTVKNW